MVVNIKTLITLTSLIILFLCLNLEVVSGKVIICNSCADCSSKIQSAYAGDTVQLTADITYTNQYSSCIEFNGADGITFDCGGHTISGDSNTGLQKGIYSSEYYGEPTDGADNCMIKNCQISNFWIGISLAYSKNTNINNITLTDNWVDNEFTGRQGTGINLRNCNNMIVDKITIDNPNDNDPSFHSISGIGIYNTIDSTFTDIDASDCSWCGIQTDNTQRNSFAKIIASNNKIGFCHQFSNDSLLSDISISNNEDAGLWVAESHNNIFTDITASNTIWGILLNGADTNTFTDITASNNQEYGIHIVGEAAYNTITSSRIEDNFEAGLYLDEAFGDIPQYNLIYDNYFSNSGTYGNVRIDSGVTYPNYFNTNLKSGNNIISGNWIGGNYWTNPSSTGFSDTCINKYSGPNQDQLGSDSICDVAYDLGSGNIDNYPLTQVSTPTCCPADNNPTNDVVSIEELINYISRWKSGSVSISELIIGIGEWKNGC